MWTQDLVIPECISVCPRKLSVALTNTITNTTKVHLVLYFLDNSPSLRKGRNLEADAEAEAMEDAVSWPSHSSGLSYRLPYTTPDHLPRVGNTHSGLSLPTSGNYRSQKCPMGQSGRVVFSIGVASYQMSS